MKRQFISSLRIPSFPLILLLGLIAIPALTTAQNEPERFEIRDGDFDPGHWDVTVVRLFDGTRTSATVQTGGNPGAYLQARHRSAVPPSNPPATVGLDVGYFNTRYPYDPAVMGRLTSLDIGLDGIMLNNEPSLFEDSYFAVRQDGVVYFLNSGFNGFSSPNWTPIAYSNLVENQFGVYYNDDLTPDFSASGSPIEFGFVRLSTTSIYNSDRPLDQQFGFDNFHVTIPSVEGSQTLADLRVESSLPDEVTYVDVTFSRQFKPDLSYTVYNDGPETAVGVEVTYDIGKPTDYLYQPNLSSIPSICRETEFSNEIFRPTYLCEMGTFEPGFIGSTSTIGPSLEVPARPDRIYQGPFSISVWAEAQGVDPTPNNAKVNNLFKVFACGADGIENTTDQCPTLTIFCLQTFGIFRRAGQEIPRLQESAARMVKASQAAFDIFTFYDVRDRIMVNRADGQRYIDLYNSHAAEINTLIMSDEALFDEALETLSLWEPNVREVVDGGTDLVITQAQIDQIDLFLTELSAAGSAELQSTITVERERLGDLDGYVDMPLSEASGILLGDQIYNGRTLFFPMVSGG